MADLQKVTDYSKEKAIVETVRKAVFPNATDEELMLFFHKCNTAHVHPLSQLIYPSKYSMPDGSKKVVFITSIDLLRSRSEETNEYDGIDEPEYIGTIIQKTEEGDIEVPEICKVRVYRKNIKRPFTGIARWKEFYPGEKRGHQWRQKSYLMLAKCAEGQARRLAFPQELDNLYTAEEMDATTAMLAGISTSTKPRVNPNDIKEIPSNTTTESDFQNYNHPTEEQIKAGKLISEKQGWYLIKECKKYGVSDKAISNFDKVENVFWLTWDKNNKNNINAILKTVKEKPNFFVKYDPAAIEAANAIKQQQQKDIQPAQSNPPAQNQPEVMDNDDFVNKINQFIEATSNYSLEDIEGMLEAEFGIKGIKNVKAEDQDNVFKFIKSIIDKNEEV